MPVGGSVASGIVGPIKDATGGGWRLPLGLLAVPALLAGLAWLARVRRSTGPAPEVPGPTPRLRRTRLAWQVTAFMGLQSLLAYVVFGRPPPPCRDPGPTA